MFGFKEEEKADLLGIVQRIISDEAEFEHMVAKTIKLSHNLPDAIDGLSGVDYFDFNEELKKMFYHYNLLLHILLELRKRGKINFNQGEQKSDLLNLVILIKKLQRLLLNIEEYVKTKMDKYDQHSYENDMGNLSSHLRTSIDTFLRSEKETMDIITKDLNGGITFTEGKITEASTGKFRVEIHQGIRLTLFGAEYTGKRSYPFGILVFDHDYLVAEAGFDEYVPKEKIIIVYTQTYFAGRGYIQRAVELLLTSGLIREWWSDKNLSYRAGQMYDRLQLKAGFEVAFVQVQQRYKVTLKSS